MSNAAPRPWRMFLPLGIVLVLALAWSIYWYVALGIAKERVAAERTALADQGVTLACSRESWGGYPFHFEYTCASPVLQYGAEARLRSGKLLLVALAYAPWQVAALLDGPTTVAAPGLTPTKMEHQRILAAITSEQGGVPNIDVDIPALAVPELGQIVKLMLHTRPSAGGGTDVAVTIAGLDFQRPGRPPLRLDSGNVLGTLKQDEVFELRKFELQQGSLRYWGSGTLSLDAAHRIAGKIDTETNDINGLLAVLAPHLDLKSSQLANLKTMLGLLGNAAKAPVIARDGMLYLGPFKIADLDPLY